MGDVLVIDLFERFEGVTGMRASPKSALVTDALAASPAVNGELLRMTLATILGLPVGSRTRGPGLLQGVQLLGNLFHPTTIDELVDVERGPTMGALGPLLREPASDAEVAAELGAVRAEVGVLQLLHADEAAEDVREGLHGRVLPPRGGDVHHGKPGDWKEQRRGSEG